MVALVILTTSIIALILYYFLQLISSKTKKPTENAALQKNKLLPLPGISIFNPKILVALFKPSAIKDALFAGKHGPICEIRLPKSRIVFINDWKLGKDIFKNPLFCGRPSNEYWKFVFPNCGFVMNSGQPWKEQRKFCSNYLRTVFFGTKHMESLIENEIQDVVQSWRRKREQTFCPNKEFYVPVVSSLWVIMSGERLQDEELKKRILDLYIGFGLFLSLGEAILCSSNIKLKTLTRIAKWIPLFPGLKIFEDSVMKLRKYLQGLISTRREIFDIGRNPTNLIDHYLSTIYKTEDPISGFFGETGYKNLEGTLFDLILAGGETTGSMLAWAMLHLVRNSDFQERIRSEMDEVVGPNRYPCPRDIDQCPYTNAFIWELLRFTGNAILSPPHEATEDSNIGPYYIKKGTWIFLNIYYIHFDSLVWDDPQNFRPERFLSADGKSVLKSEPMSAFSEGLRRCIGEQLARDSLFLFIGSICQKFILLPDPALNGIPPLKGTNGYAYTPKPFLMIASERFNHLDENLKIAK